MKTQIFLHFFLFLFGFVSGNLFPTFFGFISPFLLLILIESFNFLLRSLKRPARGLKTFPQPKFSFFSSEFFGSAGKLRSRKELFGRSRWQNLNDPTSGYFQNGKFGNSIKIGFLFGLFVDAFKVGS